MTRFSRTTLGVGAIVLLAIALRAAYVLRIDPPPEMPGLTRKYVVCATNLREGNGFYLQVSPPVPYVDRFPGYVAFLAVLQALVGLAPRALALAHAAVGSLAIVPVFRLGRRLCGTRAGLCAAVVQAAWPPLWKADVQVLETGLCCVVLAALVDALFVHLDGPSTAHAWLLGGLSAAAVALRPEYVLVPAIVAITGAVRLPRARWTTLVPTLLLPALLLVPWAVRNAHVADGAFVSVGLGTNLLAAVGETSASDEPLLGDQAVARSEGYDGLYWPAPGKRDRERVHLALALVARAPLRYAWGCVRRVPITLCLYSGPLWPGHPGIEETVARWRHDHAGAARYSGLFEAGASYVRHDPVAAGLSLGWGPLLLGLATAGAWLLRRRLRDLATLAVLPAYGLLVHVPLHAEPRYFFPFVFALTVLAGGALGRYAGKPAGFPASLGTIRSLPRPPSGASGCAGRGSRYRA